MKKINDEFLKMDLHIHTIKTDKDSQDIDYDVEILIEYVKQNDLDIIGITNHDYFNKEQFLSIKEAAKKNSFYVLMGAEITLDGTHILIFSNEDINIFYEKIQKINDEIKHQKEISFSGFQNILGNLNNYILIPHYIKRPSILERKNLLEDLRPFLKVVECRHWKDFNKILKQEEYNPCIFSDNRIGRNQSKEKK